MEEHNRGQSLCEVMLARHTGLLIGWRETVGPFQGTFEECLAEYRRAQIHNLVFGWWSIGSAIFGNWFALFKNFRAASKLKQLSREVA